MEQLSPPRYSTSPEHSSSWLKFQLGLSKPSSQSARHLNRQQQQQQQHYLNTLGLRLNAAGKIKPTVVHIPSLENRWKIQYNYQTKVLNRSIGVDAFPFDPPTSRRNSRDWPRTDPGHRSKNDGGKDTTRAKGPAVETLVRGKEQRSPRSRTGTPELVTTTPIRLLGVLRSPEYTVNWRSNDGQHKSPRYFCFPPVTGARTGTSYVRTERRGQVSTAPAGSRLPNGTAKENMFDFSRSSSFESLPSSWKYAQATTKSCSNEVTHDLTPRVTEYATTEMSALPTIDEDDAATFEMNHSISVRISRNNSNNNHYNNNSCNDNDQRFELLRHASDEGDEDTDSCSVYDDDSDDADEEWSRESETHTSSVVGVPQAKMTVGEQTNTDQGKDQSEDHNEDQNAEQNGDLNEDEIRDQNGYLSGDESEEQNANPNGDLIEDHNGIQNGYLSTDQNGDLSVYNEDDYQEYETWTKEGEYLPSTQPPVYPPLTSRRRENQSTPVPCDIPTIVEPQSCKTNKDMDAIDEQHESMEVLDNLGQIREADKARDSCTEVSIHDASGRDEFIEGRSQKVISSRDMGDSNGSTQHVQRSDEEKIEGNILKYTTDENNNVPDAYDQNQVTRGTTGDVSETFSESKTDKNNAQNNVERNSLEADEGTFEIDGRSVTAEANELKIETTEALVDNSTQLSHLTDLLQSGMISQVQLSLSDLDCRGQENGPSSEEPSPCFLEEKLDSASDASGAENVSLESISDRQEELSPQRETVARKRSVRFSTDLATVYLFSTMTPTDDSETSDSGFLSP